MAESMQQRLEKFLAESFPRWQDIKLGDVSNITSGWESDVYAFDVEHGLPGSRDRANLILRVFPGDSAEAKAAHEYKSMRLLRDARYPVPRLFHLELGDTPIGRPFILMARIDGQVMWHMLDRAPDEERESLIDRFCELQAKLHSLDWHDFHDVGSATAGWEDDPYFFIDGWLRQARELLEATPDIGLQPAIEWLAARRDDLTCSLPSPIHMDFHPANILVRPDGFALVIDWTGFEISDPRFDLAWSLLLIHAYSGEEVRDSVFAGYEREMGKTVEHLDAFEVFACVRRLYTILVSLAGGAASMGMRPEAADTIREQIEPARRVYELLVERTGIPLPLVEAALAEPIAT